MRKALLIIALLVSHSAIASPEMDRCLRKLEYLSDLADASLVDVHNYFYGERIRADNRFYPVVGKKDRYSFTRDLSGRVVNAVNVSRALRATAMQQGNKCMEIEE